MLSFAATILLDGISYGMVLFLISVGLTITMGLMRVVNLAHGSFAMIGGYTAGYLTQKGINFYLAIIGAAVVAGALGGLAEVTVYRPLYRKGELSQVLLTIGIVFVATAIATEMFGAFPYPMVFPDYLSLPINIGFRTYPAYRLFLIVVGAIIAAVMWYLIDNSLYGAKLRAAVDNSKIARCVGMNVNLLFTGTFVIGCALAGIGGAVGAGILSLEPSYALKYVVLFLVVVIVGGEGSFKGSFVAAMALGIIDTLGKYFVTQAAPYLLYAAVFVLAAMAAARPDAIEGGWLMAAMSEDKPAASPATNLGAAARPGWWLRLIAHAIPWAIIIIFFYMAGGYLSLGTQVLIWILFALSLDLALGYAGIVTLGQAAFFGIGAYAAGLFAIHVSPDPILGHLAAIVVAALFGLITGDLHTTGVTFLMLTLAIVSMLFEYANQARSLTGGDDGLQGMTVNPIFGVFEFNIFGETAYVYAAVVLFIWFLISWRIVHSPFGRSLDGIRQNTRRMRAIGTPVWWRLLAVYTLSAAMAGSAGALSAHATRFVGLSVLSLLTSGIVTVMLILGGTRRLYGAFVGAAVYYLVQDETARISPYFWELVVGLMLIATVLFLEGGLLDLVRVAQRLFQRLRRRTDAR